MGKILFFHLTLILGAFSSIGVLSSSLAGRALNTVPLPSNAVALQCDDINMVLLGREQQDSDTIHAGPGAAKGQLQLHLHILGKYSLCLPHAKVATSVRDYCLWRHSSQAIGR